MINHQIDLAVNARVDAEGGLVVPERVEVVCGWLALVAAWAQGEYAMCVSWATPAP